MDLTSRSGAQVDSYVAVMNTMKIKTQPLLNGRKYSYNYRTEANAVKSSVPKRLIRIGKELSSLSNSLPIHDTSSVMVCIDEERPDCLKALIVGPAGTPYENGLFEFDIFLPANYPNAPPKVILITTGSGQIRFNPNLYKEGKVCLSLLGTWAGPGWHPKCTLLQVLISIQSLILVDEPFFNEPGFEKHQGSEAGVRIFFVLLSLVVVGGRASLLCAGSRSMFLTLLSSLFAVSFDTTTQLHDNTTEQH